MDPVRFGYDEGYDLRTSNNNEHRSAADELSMPDADLQLARRSFLKQSGVSLGAAALTWLLARDTRAGHGGSTELPHFAPTAKRVVFLHQSGAPSQIDLFDAKPELARRHGSELPADVRMGQRLTTMTSEQAQKPLAASPFEFSRHGASGIEVSELLPHTARTADHLCVVRSLQTEAINHDPALTVFQTGVQQPGRPSMGSWISYGLGSDCDNLPAFVVLVSGGDPGDQPLFQRLWDSAFLPPANQGVRFRSGRDPVLFLSNPPGIDTGVRRRMLDTLAQLNRSHYAESGDPAIAARIEQFELACRMQSAVPELCDVEAEPEHTFSLYGDDARRPGTYAANCLMARRLAERGVRFIQLYHRGWDHHTHIENRLRQKCQETDQPSAALVQDLKQRGLLDETLIVWAGEFGRTAYCQGQLGSTDYGRDHHPRCFSIWLAGGGIRSGLTFGRTDDLSYNVVENPVSVNDLQATILHTLGVAHERLTYRFAGRDHRLTDVAGKVVREILA